MSINADAFTSLFSLTLMILYGDNLGDRRRLLLRGLTQSLPEILPLLYNVSVGWFCFSE